MVSGMVKLVFDNKVDAVEVAANTVPEDPVRTE